MNWWVKQRKGADLAGVGVEISRQNILELSGKLWINFHPTLLITQSQTCSSRVVFYTRVERQEHTQPYSQYGHHVLFHLWHLHILTEDNVVSYFHFINQAFNACSANCPQQILQNYKTVSLLLKYRQQPNNPVMCRDWERSAWRCTVVFGVRGLQDERKMQYESCFLLEHWEIKMFRTMIIQMIAKIQ